MQFLLYAWIIYVIYSKFLLDCRPTELLVSLKSIMYNHGEQILIALFTVVFILTS